MDDLTKERAQCYAAVFGDRPEVTAVLDDLVSQASGQADPLVKAGYMLAVHRIYQMRAALRRDRRRALASKKVV